MITAWTQQGRIWASRRRDGDLEIKDLGPAEYAAFVRNPIDLDGVTETRPDFPGWTKLLFRDYDSRRAALEAHPTALYEADVNPVRRYMADHNCKIDRPERVYLDIETDSRVSFSKAILGHTRLLSFALVDEHGTNHTAVLEDDHDQAEAELWGELWKLMGRYDQVAAWNGDRFDFEVLKTRSEALVKPYKRSMEAFWEHRRRLLFVDHLACFKRHHMSAESGDDKTSFALNAVCEAVLGEGKHDFDAGKTWEAWAAGGAARQELVDYNLQDTALLPKLEAETGYLELQQTLAELTWTPVSSHGLSPMPQVDGYMLRMAHTLQTHLPSKRPPSGAEEQYEGAFVLPPQSLGIHRTVHCVDFKSLYPTVIRTFNISPETKGTGIDPCTAFRTGVEFDTAYEGMVPKACREAMELREYWKQEYKRDPNNKAAERTSKAYKIFANSIYGVMGCTYSRYYDPQIAESVTLSAKHLNEVTADEIRKRGWHVLYQDTDSSMFTGCSVEECSAFVDWCNTELYPTLLDAQNVPRERQCIALDYEKCFDKLIFPLGRNGKPAAKRYFGSYRHYAFKPKSKPEIRGLEYMRGDSVRYARRLQHEAMMLLLADGTTAEQMHEWVKRQREIFFDSHIAVEDIAKSAGISQALSDYKSAGPHVRVARLLESRGEDVSEGTRISYIVINGAVSPSEVIPVADYQGVFDRVYYWSNAIYPATMRVLDGAFPGHPWYRWIAKRPKPTLAGQLSLLT